MEYANQQSQPSAHEDGEDVNPYASPQTTCGPAESALAEVDLQGVWRDGDQLVMACHGAVVPKACCLTNRDEHLERWYYPVFGRRSEWFAITVLVWIPFSSLFILLLSLVPTRFLSHVPGNIATINLWFHRRIYRGIWSFFGQIGILAYLIASVAAGYMLISSNWIAAAVSYTVLALGVVFIEIAEKLKPVKPRVVDGFIRISGVHPDYLARLGDFASRESNA